MTSRTYRMTIKMTIRIWQMTTLSLEISFQHLQDDNPNVEDDSPDLEDNPDLDPRNVVHL